MRGVFVIAASIAFVIALEAILSAFRYLSQRRTQELRRRLQSFSEGAHAAAGLLRSGRLARTARLATILERMPLARRTEQLLEAADARITVAQLWSYSAAAAAAPIVAGFSLGLAPFAVLLVVIIAAGTPSLLMMIAADRRSRSVSEQLPEALEMMSRALRAGHATSAAFQTVATEMPQPISVEFARAFEEQRLGLPLDRAVVHMTERARGNRDLKIFAVSVIIQKETGGNLAEMLSGIAETIRARYRFHGKLRALTAEGRASALVLGLLPVAFVLLMQIISPGFTTPLVEDPVGRTIALFGTLSWAMGVLWVYRMTKVDV